MPMACGHLLVLSSMRLPGAYGMWSSASAFLHEIAWLPVACGHLLVLSSMRLPGAYGMWSSASAFLHEIAWCLWHVVIC